MLGCLLLILKVLSNDSKITDTHGKVIMNTGYTEVIIVHMRTAEAYLHGEGVFCGTRNAKSCNG